MTDHAQNHPPAPVDKGPWRPGVTEDKKQKRHFIESDDFTHDVRLYIDGDFEGSAQKAAYAAGMATLLNQALSAASLAPPERLFIDQKHLPDAHNAAINPASDTSKDPQNDAPLGWALMPEYPGDAWVDAFFGPANDVGVYHFCGDFGNVAYAYQKAMRLGLTPRQGPSGLFRKFLDEAAQNAITALPINNFGAARAERPTDEPAPNLQEIVRDAVKNAQAAIRTLESLSYSRIEDQWVAPEPDVPSHLLDRGTELRSEYDWRLLGGANRFAQALMSQYAQVAPGFVFLGCARLGAAGASDEEILNYAQRTMSPLGTQSLLNALKKAGINAKQTVTKVGL